MSNLLLQKIVLLWVTEVGKIILKKKRPLLLARSVDLKKWTHIQEASGYSTAPNATSTISCKGWNFPEEYPSRKSKNDLKEYQNQNLLITDSAVENGLPWYVSDVPFFLEWRWVPENCTLIYEAGYITLI